MRSLQSSKMAAHGPRKDYHSSLVSLAPSSLCSVSISLCAHPSSCALIEPTGCDSAVHVGVQIIKKRILLIFVVDGRGGPKCRLGCSLVYARDYFDEWSSRIRHRSRYAFRDYRY